jgi:hypothetical protein
MGVFGEQAAESCKSQISAAPRSLLILVIFISLRRFLSTFITHTKIIKNNKKNLGKVPVTRLEGCVCAMLAVIVGNWESFYGIKLTNFFYMPHNKKFLTHSRRASPSMTTDDDNDDDDKKISLLRYAGYATMCKNFHNFCHNEH